MQVHANRGDRYAAAYDIIQSNLRNRLSIFPIADALRTGVKRSGLVIINQLLHYDFITQV